MFFLELTRTETGELPSPTPILLLLLLTGPQDLPAAPQEGGPLGHPPLVLLGVRWGDPACESPIADRHLTGTHCVHWSLQSCSHGLHVPCICSYEPAYAVMST